MKEFGFNTFISTLLPGGLVSVAFFIVAKEYYSDTEFYTWLISAQSQDFLFTTLALFCSSFFGVFLGTLGEFVEWRILDNIAAKNLGVTRKKYNKHWYFYLESLVNGSNSYISYKALVFRFELRTSFALLLLSIVLFISKEYCIAGAVVLVVAIAMFYFSYESHYVLAESRARFYENYKKNKNKI